MDILADSNAWLEGERHLYLTQSITIKQGLVSVSLSATIGETEYQAEDTEGNVIVTQSVDFIVRPEDLGGLTLTSGDKVERTVGSEVLEYEVWAPRGEDFFHYDTMRTSIRINTQLISEVDV